MSTIDMYLYNVCYGMMYILQQHSSKELTIRLKLVTNVRHKIDLYNNNTNRAVINAI